MTESEMPPWRLVLRRPSITGESPVWCNRTARLYWVDVQQPALAGHPEIGDGSLEEMSRAVELM